MPPNIKPVSSPAEGLKPKLTLGGSSSAAPFTVRVDPPLPAALQPLGNSVVAYLKASALNAVLTPNPAGLDPVGALFRQRFALNRPDVQQRGRATATRLVALPVDQKRPELLQYADVDILASGALTALSVPADVTALTRTFRSGVAPAALPAGATGTSGQALTASIALDFLLDVVRCDVDTNDPSRDRILLGGTIIDADGSTKKLDSSMIGEFDRGTTMTFNRVLSTFDMPTSTGLYPRTYSLLLVMAEEDYGSYPEWLTKITEEVAKKVKEWAEKAIKDAGSGDFWTYVGAGLAWIASWALDKIFSWIKGLYEDDHIQSHVFALKIDQPIVSFGNGMSMQYQDTIFAGDGGQYTVTTAWHIRADGEVSTFRVGPLEIIKVVKESTMDRKPAVTIDLPAGYKLLGGGARANWSTAGQLLTSAYPASPTTWVASSKDHLSTEQSTITAFAFGARLANGSPIPDADHAIVKVESARAAHPAASAGVPDGFTLLGGGARVNWDVVQKMRPPGADTPENDPKPSSGTTPADPAGNLLTASYPMNNTWFAASKDHGVADSCSISAYAVGVRSSLLGGLKVQIVSATSPSATSWPATLAAAPAGSWILGGGANVIYTEPGSLMTASFPEVAYWVAAAKDHMYASPATITAYAIVAEGPDAPRMPGRIGEHVEEKSAFADNGFTGNDVAQEWRVYPGLPRPQGNWRLMFEEQILLQRNLNNHEVFADPQASPDHIVIRVTVHGEGFWGTTGRFRAAYRVWWQQT